MHGLQLLAYAVGTRELLLEHRHSVTLSRDVVEKFYPLLADVILEVSWQLRFAHRRALTCAACRHSSETATTRPRLARCDRCVSRVCGVSLSENGHTELSSLHQAAKADDKLVRLMQQDAVIRKVALAYILQRVTVGDLPSAEPLLLAAKEACSCCVCLGRVPRFTA